MASGDEVGKIEKRMFPDSSSAAIVIRQGGSTPPENFEVLAFDNSTDEYIDYQCHMTGYDGGGLTVKLFWGAATATSGNVEWKVALRRLNDDVEDIDTSHTYAFNTVTDAAPSASGEFTEANVTFTDGADMDSVADTERFVLRIGRETSGVTGNMSGDAQLLSVIVTET